MRPQEAGDGLESMVEFQVQIKGHNKREYEDKWQGWQYGMQLLPAGRFLAGKNSMLVCLTIYSKRVSVKFDTSTVWQVDSCNWAEQYAGLLFRV